VGDIEELANAFADLQHSSEIPKGDEAPPGPWTRAQEKEPVDHEWDADAVWQEWHDLYCALATCNDAPSLDELAADGPIFDSIAAELSPYLHDAELEGGPPPNSVRPGGGMSLLRLCGVGPQDIAESAVRGAVFPQRHMPRDSEGAIRLRNNGSGANAV